METTFEQIGQFKLFQFTRAEDDPWYRQLKELQDLSDGQFGGGADPWHPSTYVRVSDCEAAFVWNQSRRPHWHKVPRDTPVRVP